MKSLTTTELIEIREKAREQKNYALSDEIRDILDSRHSFVFDTNNGQVIYHELGGTRNDLIAKINKNKKLESIFDAWLYSMKHEKQLIKNNIGK